MKELRRIQTNDIEKVDSYIQEICINRDGSLERNKALNLLVYSFLSNEDLRALLDKYRLCVSELRGLELHKIVCYFAGAIHYTDDQYQFLLPSSNISFGIERLNFLGKHIDLDLNMGTKNSILNGFQSRDFFLLPETVVENYIKCVFKNNILNLNNNLKNLKYYPIRSSLIVLYSLLETIHSKDFKEKLPQSIMKDIYLLEKDKYIENSLSLIDLCDFGKKNEILLKVELASIYIKEVITESNNKVKIYLNPICNYLNEINYPMDYNHLLLKRLKENDFAFNKKEVKLFDDLFVLIENDNLKKIIGNKCQPPKKKRI